MSHMTTRACSAILFDICAVTVLQIKSFSCLSSPAGHRRSPRRPSLSGFVVSAISKLSGGDLSLCQACHLAGLQTDCTDLRLLGVSIEWPSAVVCASGSCLQLGMKCCRGPSPECASCLACVRSKKLNLVADAGFKACSSAVGFMQLP